MSAEDLDLWEGAVTGILLDTHAWVWTLTDASRLSRPAREAIEGADAVLSAPSASSRSPRRCVSDAGRKSRACASAFPSSSAKRAESRLRSRPRICLRAGLTDWDHRDPFDRLLAATAETLAVPLVTRDTVFAGRRSLAVVW